MPDRSRRILAACLGGAALLSAAPQQSQAPWSGWVAAAVRLPLEPAVRGLGTVRDWVRPPDRPYAGLPEELRAALGDRDRLQGELNAAQLRVQDLERQLALLVRYRPADRSGWRPQPAPVVARGGGRPAGMIGIGTGSADGVAAGDPVVVGGNSLVGRVAEGVGEDRSWVIPADDRRIGLIDAEVRPSGTAGTGAAPPGKPQGPRGNVLVQLRPKGDRRLEGVLESPSNGQGAEVRVGDEVVLADATWPSSALGTRIGTVESAGPLDSNPLRRSVVVRMDCDPTRLGEDVIVKVRDVEGGRR
jgi:cell shape-determining protein MreC